MIEIVGVGGTGEWYAITYFYYHVSYPYLICFNLFSTKYGSKWPASYKKAHALEESGGKRLGSWVHPNRSRRGGNAPQIDFDRFWRLRFVISLVAHIVKNTSSCIVSLFIVSVTLYANIF